MLQDRSPKRYVKCLIVIAALTLPMSGCTAAAPDATATSSSAFTLTSTAFEAGQTIPNDYACHGKNISPPLAWTGAPSGTTSYALIMDDPDAMAVVGYVYNHWLVFNIPASAASLPENVPAEDILPDGSQQGRNNSNKVGYSGPCPPGTQSHKYVFTLYALDTMLTLDSGASKEELLKALEGHILAQTELTGQYASP